MGHDDIGHSKEDDDKKDVTNEFPLTDRKNIKQVLVIYFCFQTMAYFQMA